MDFRDQFPLDLDLEFSMFQWNKDLKELLSERIILHLDLRCIFSMSLIENPSSKISDKNIMKLRKG